MSDRVPIALAPGMVACGRHGCDWSQESWSDEALMAALMAHSANHD